MRDMHTNMLELFAHGKNTLDLLLLPEISRWSRSASEATLTLNYSYDYTVYFVELSGDERTDSVIVRAKLPLSAVEELSMDVNGRTMTGTHNDGSTRELKEELGHIRVYSTHIIVLTAELTDTGSVDCILKAFLQAIKNGVYS